MSEALNAAIRAWENLERHPALMLGLTVGGDPLAPSALADLLLEGVARPHDPRSAVEVLIDAGEYETADALIHRLEPPLSTELSRRATAARRGWEQEAHVRLLALRTRARQVDIDVPGQLTPQGLARRVAGQATLDEFEALVSDAESTVRETLLIRLADSDRTADVHHQDEAVRRCLASGQYEAARFLMEGPHGVLGGPSRPIAECWPATKSGPLLADAAAVVRPAPWPWTAGAGEVLTWLQPDQAAPPTFRGDFGPADDDAAAVSLLEALASTSDGHLNNELRAAIDAFVGEEPRSGALAALDDRLLAPVRGLNSQANIWLSNEREPTGDGFLILRPADLLAMLGERGTRRVSLLRLLGRQLPLAHRIDVDAAADLSISDIDELRHYVSWLLDIVGVLAAPAVPEVIVWLGAGRPQLVAALLSEVLGRSAGRERRIELAQVLAAAETLSFRSAAQRQLTAETSRHPPAAAVLDALHWFDPLGRETVSVDDIVEVIELLDDIPPAGAVRPALDALEATGLIDAVEGGYRLHAAAVVLLRLKMDS